MELNVITGTISTTIFALSNIPMLIKAAKTRSLSSYSFTYIIMNNVANLIHWFYVSALPVGPIWFLHSFYTVSAALILLWYVRYERGMKSFLVSPVSEENQRRETSQMQKAGVSDEPKEKVVGYC